MTGELVGYDIGYWTEDGEFIKMRQIALTYQLPPELFDPAGGVNKEDETVLFAGVQSRSAVEGLLWGSQVGGEFLQDVQQIPFLAALAREAPNL